MVSGVLCDPGRTWRLLRPHGDVFEAGKLKAGVAFAVSFTLNAAGSASLVRRYRLSD